MRALVRTALLVMIAMASITPRLAAQGDPDRVIPNGGVFAPGWTGKIDAGSEKAGGKLANARLAQEGQDLHVTTGPATTYWNPANKATGDFTVKATFTEPQYMNLNSHPHSYGVFIGGNDMGTENMSLMYCAAYGNGTFIVRGFGPKPFQVEGEGYAGKTNPAVNKAAAKGAPVTQEIALQVKGDAVSCLINGKAVWTGAKKDVVAAGKLKSTDGVYGLRFTHNVEAVIKGFGVTKAATNQ
jgi:hypothetical protein